jgi:hypothetical protein
MVRAISADTRRRKVFLERIRTARDPRRKFLAVCEWLFLEANDRGTETRKQTQRDLLIRINQLRQEPRLPKPPRRTARRHIR